MERVEVWCSNEKRVVGYLPQSMGTITAAKFWQLFQPVNGSYRLSLFGNYGNNAEHAGQAHCPRCQAFLLLPVPIATTMLSPEEEREMAVKREEAKRHVASGQTVPTRTQLRDELSSRHRSDLVRAFGPVSGGVGPSMDGAPILFGSTCLP